jgi:putative phage-type endonuclease
MPLIQVTSHTPEWYAIRKQHVGASDVSALFGLSPYKTKRELWLEKAGKADDSFKDNSCKLFGREAEEAIARVAAFEKGWQIEKVGGYVTHATVKGMGCTPDRQIVGLEKGLGLLEIKNVGHFSYLRRWVDDQPPADHQLQLQHQLACCQHLGFTWGAIAAWISGQYLKVIEYEIRPKAIAIIEKQITNFWESIEAGIEPIEELAA